MRIHVYPRADKNLRPCTDRHINTRHRYLSIHRKLFCRQLTKYIGTPGEYTPIKWSHMQTCKCTIKHSSAQKLAHALTCAHAWTHTHIHTPWQTHPDTCTDMNR